MIKHSNPTITNKQLRELLARELWSVHKTSKSERDLFFYGYIYGMSNAYERIQQNLNSIKVEQ